MDSEEYYSAEEAAKVLGITNRRVRQLAQEGKIEAERTDAGWKFFRASVHAFRDGKGGRKVQETVAVAGSWPDEARDALKRAYSLERELGRFEGRLEIEAVTRSTLEESLRREQERADRLEQREQELQQELKNIRESWWYKFFH
jgi:excisionase family DNA binding protein